MSHANTPDDGDFSRFVEQMQKITPITATDSLLDAQPGFASAPFDTADLNRELTQEIAALSDAPPLSDEELERQALANGPAEDYVEEEAKPATVADRDEAGIEAEVLPFDHSTMGSVTLEVATLSGEVEEEIAAMQALPLSDAELERQALASGGAGEDSLSQ